MSVPPCYILANMSKTFEKILEQTNVFFTLGKYNTEIEAFLIGKLVHNDTDILSLKAP